MSDFDFDRDAPRPRRSGGSVPQGFGLGCGFIFGALFAVMLLCGGLLAATLALIPSGRKETQEAEPVRDKSEKQGRAKTKPAGTEPAAAPVKREPADDVELTWLEAHWRGLRVGAVGRFEVDGIVPRPKGYPVRIVSVIDRSSALVAFGPKYFIVKGLDFSALADDDRIELTGFYWVSGTTKRGFSTYYVVEHLSEEKQAVYGRRWRKMLDEVKKAQEEEKKRRLKLREKTKTLTAATLAVGQKGVFGNPDVAIVVSFYDNGMVVVRLGKPGSEFIIDGLKGPWRAGQRVSLSGGWTVTGTHKIRGKEYFVLKPE